MQLVMRVILGPDAAKEWEDGRDHQITTYDMARM